MVKKIISGGQTGADRAALDVAIKLDIPHGGWVPKGRRAEDGALPDHYQLKEMPDSNYPSRTEQNVLDSDGTVIFSHGALTGGSLLTKKLAIKHDRPWLHLDLNRTGAFEAAQKLKSWTERNHIGILNVAGSKASKNPRIYTATFSILESFCYLDLMGTGSASSVLTDSKSQGPMVLQTLPATINEAVDTLIAGMSLKDKTYVAYMEKEHLPELTATLGRYILDEFRLRHGNEPLLQSFMDELAPEPFTTEDALLLIFERLWTQLRQTHMLRRVK